ncbi:MAG TPA: chitobiase/beta-hexosaminidase C-terminal domain-containing protein [Polyangiaceae bacterium]|jgi:hypothetical protein
MSRASFFLLFAVGLFGCGGSTVAAAPGGDAGPPLDASADRTAADAPYDAPVHAPDASDAAPDDAAAEASACATPMPQLGVPTFDPPGGECFPGQGTVTLAPPSGSPNAQLFYSLDGTPPTPQKGMLYTHPIQLATATTVSAIAHDPTGCAPDSPLAAATYTVGSPTLSCDSVPVVFKPPSTSSYEPFFVSLSLPGPATLCYTLDGTTPTCSAATGDCTGSTLTYDAATDIAIAPAITDPSTGKVTVSAIACAVGVASAGQSSQTYQLLLAAPFLASANPDGSGLPGVATTDAGAAPITTMTIPSDAGVPYGPFVAQQIGSGAFPLADYVCWSNTGPATCACAAPLALTKAAPSATLPASADVSPGSTLSVVACQSSPAVNAATGYGPSSATTVQF